MRPTREVVLIIFAAVGTASVFAAIVGLLIIELVHPAERTADGFKAFAEVIALMLGAVMGYLLGRRDKTSS